jgi:hypothetical protein
MALAECRKRGWYPEVTEHWCQFSKRRKDLFGMIDILCINTGYTLGIQVTTGSNHAHRVVKLAGHKNFRYWLACTKRRLQVWSYRKDKMGKWKLRVQELRLGDAL